MSVELAICHLVADWRCALFAGVSLEWHLSTCPCCTAQLTARLCCARNTVQCAFCGIAFDCENRDIASNPPAPIAPCRYPMRGPSMRFRQFISKTLLQLYAESRGVAPRDGSGPAVESPGGDDGDGAESDNLCDNKRIFARAMEMWKIEESDRIEREAVGTGSATAETAAGGSAAEASDAVPPDVSSPEASGRLVAGRAQPLVPTAVPKVWRPRKVKRVRADEAKTGDSTQGAKKPCARTPFSPLVQQRAAAPAPAPAHAPALAIVLFPTLAHDPTPAPALVPVLAPAPVPTATPTAAPALPSTPAHMPRSARKRVAPTLWQ